MRVLKTEELALVAGGGDCCCCCDGGDDEPKEKGNNGWGNGPDSTNNGSFSGGTAGSKSDNQWDDGDGPRPAKFSTR